MRARDDSQDAAAGTQPVVYCLVPRELASKLHDPLRRHFRDDPSIEVIVERRAHERRRASDRRSPDAPAPNAERRRIRGAEGRRAGERRAALVPVEPRALPRRARGHADRLVFVQRLEPSSEQLEDIDSAYVVSRVQAGDREAFGTLYLRYFDRVYSYLRVVLKDAHSAEEGTQHVFAKVFEALPAYERRSQPFRAWLFRIVRNYALDQLRERARVDTVDPRTVERLREHGSDDATVRALQWISDREVLLFVERLPLAQRQVLVLRYLLGLDTPEIVAVLDRTPESVRQLEHRALRFLESRLSVIGQEPAKKKKRLSMRRIGRRGARLKRHDFNLG